MFNGYSKKQANKHQFYDALWDRIMATGKVGKMSDKDLAAEYTGITGIPLSASFISRRRKMAGIKPYRKPTRSCYKRSLGGAQYRSLRYRRQAEISELLRNWRPMDGGMDGPVMVYDCWPEGA